VAISRGLAVESLPSVDGVISGELKLFERNPEFSLPWKITFSRAIGSEQTFGFNVDAPGTRLKAAGQINLITGNGTWRIEEGRADAAVWLALVGPKLGAVLSGASAQGSMTVMGEGIVHQGQAVGRLKFEWRDGVLAHAVQGWTLTGIAFAGEFAIDVVASRLVSTAPFELTVGTVSHPRFGARNISLRAMLNERRALSVTAARVEIAGGEVIVEPCEIPLIPPTVSANLHINRVGLQDIVLLVPAAGLAEARGRIDGVVRIRWDEALGIQLGVGSLTLRNDEPTIVRLTPSLGLLTARVPQNFDLLPSWMGPLSRWIRAKNPAYENMQSIELGKTDLQVKTLDVMLTPEGDGRGRSATVRLVAQPLQPGGSVKEVAFDVNVAGPLNEVLKLGLTQNFAVEAH
jgi:hypothetical protein